MPAAGPVAYASVSDLFGATGGYLANPNPGTNSTIATTLLNVASRFIDEKCGRFFYSDGSYRRFFDVISATREVTIWPDMFGKFGTIAAASLGSSTLIFTQAGQAPGPAPVAGDTFQLDIGGNNEQVTVSSVTGSGPYTLNLSSPTAFNHLAGTVASTISIQFANYENQPLAQWQTIQGDGITGGSTNYYLWPSNPKPYLATTTTAVSPWQGFNMPLTPVGGSSYLPTPRPGSRTVAITAYWGWPAVPDLIKDLTLKLAARAWEHRSVGWQPDASEPQGGGLNMSHHFDTRDEELLISSGYVRWAI